MADETMRLSIKSHHSDHVNYPFKLVIFMFLLILILILTTSLLQLLLTCPSPGSCMCSRQTTSFLCSRPSTICVQVEGPLIYPWSIAREYTMTPCWPAWDSCTLPYKARVMQGHQANVHSDPLLDTAGLPYKARPMEAIYR